MSRRMVTVVAAALVLPVAAGCTSDADRSTPAAVTCHTQYRPDAESLTDSSEPSVTVRRADELTAQPERVEFATLSLEVAFHGDAPEGHNVTLEVTTTDGELLVRNLYQYADGDELRTAFAGGHGFTGLQYVFHAGASLQVWCEAEEA